MPKIKGKTVSLERIKTPHYEKEYNVKWDGGIIGSIFLNNASWGAVTNFDKIACKFAFSKDGAIKALIRVFKEGFDSPQPEAAE